ncbi:cell surface glycoprotein 1-like isoform X1 [Pantherophis guttatus]|uniref:Cell surface glycoprotein 1-like isoform X1 n=2 Tax=Pantherophis guttatus TaxID=94885 RepID=A0A6P9CLM1_PANGU|nr:cell surface glycoprotein 1-like isoform X1 [Pantherophis guttatus]
MKPGALLLLVGSVALWTGLPAAPPRSSEYRLLLSTGTSGQPPLPPSGAPGEAPQDKISQKEEAKLACLMGQEPEVAQKSPLPQGKESEEPQPGKEGSLRPEAAGPAPPGKLLCKEKPQPERPPVNNLEVESSGSPRSVEKPQGASEKDPSLDTWTQLGGAPAKPSSLGRSKLASKPALPNLETWNPVWDPSNVATSGGKPNTSKKPTSSTPGDKPTPGMGKATPTEKPVPGSGHTIQDKPKPASAAGHHVGPTSGEKPAPNRGPEAHGRPVTGEKPTPGEKPSSQVGHEKRPSADKATSSEKPEEDGERPEAEKESKPEKEAEEGKKTEEEEEGLFEDDEEEEEGEKGKENEGNQEGNQDGDDAFDKELDYGLNTSPFDAYSYHDGWSDEGAEEADLGLVGEMAALPQAGDANNDGKPTFDAWGDLVGGSRP